MTSIDWNPMPYLGPVPINWYGITFALAVFTSRSLVIRWAPKYGVSKDSIDRLLLWILVGVVAGARLYYVVQNDFLSYLTHPWRILAIWEGGLAFFGVRANKSTCSLEWRLRLKRCSYYRFRLIESGLRGVS